MKNSITLNKLVVFATILFSSITFKAQSQMSFGVLLNTTTTGNGHGLVYNPGIMVSKGNSLFALELNIQKRKGNVTGSQLTYEYTIYNGINSRNRCGESDIFDVFLYLNARYNQNQLLGTSQIKVEKKIDPESSIDFNNVRLNTAEMYLGFGVRTKLVKGLNWVNSIGIGGYTTFNNIDILYREKSTICLSLKTGLSFEF